MNRFEKKCLIASAGMHGFLLLVVLFGSAFFVAKDRKLDLPKLQFYPSRFVESALAGGGGNPNIARTDDVQKGRPDPAAPAVVSKPKDAPKQEPPPEPPARKPEPKPPDPEPEKPQVAKKPPTKPPETKPKTPDKSPEARPRIDLTDLKPVSKEEKRKKQAEEAAAEAAAAARRQQAADRQKMAKAFGQAAADLQRGFSSGTKVDVGGPGGEAYANYAALVQAAYEHAWQLLPDLTDDDSVALVRVTISRSGKVTESRIINRSGNALMDKSVQQALDRVRNHGLPPFPDFIRDAERTFTIEFNLKTKRLLG